MRYGTLSIDVMSSSELSPCAKLVLCALRMFENPRSKRCNPSQSQIAEAIGSGRATVQRALQSLAIAGHIHIDDSGNRASYTLLDGAKRVNKVTQNESMRMTQNESSMASKRVSNGLKMSQHIDNEENKKKNTLKNIDRASRPDIDDPLKKLHRTARKLWPRISRRKYNGGELTKLFRTHGDAVEAALETIVRDGRDIQAVIPYLRTMLAESPEPSPTPPHPDRQDASDDPWERHARECSISNILAMRGDREPFAEVA